MGPPRGSLGVPVGVSGGTKNGGCSRGASWDGPGRPLGCFWSYWAILGTVPRSQNVVILFVLDGFLMCHVFLMFFHTYLKATLFSLKTKTHTVILLIMGSQNVDISLVLAMVLEIYVFRRCVFNDSLLRFRCKNHVHW